MKIVTAADSRQKPHAAMIVNWGEAPGRVLQDITIVNERYGLRRVTICTQTTDPKWSGEANQAYDMEVLRPSKNRLKQILKSGDEDEKDWLRKMEVDSMEDYVHVCHKLLIEVEFYEGQALRPIIIDCTGMPEVVKNTAMHVAGLYPDKVIPIYNPSNIAFNASTEERLKDPGKAADAKYNPSNIADNPVKAGSKSKDKPKSGNYILLTFPHMDRGLWINESNQKYVLRAAFNLHSRERMRAFSEERLQKEYESIAPDKLKGKDPKVACTKALSRLKETGFIQELKVDDEGQLFLGLIGQGFASHYFQTHE